MSPEVRPHVHLEVTTCHAQILADRAWTILRSWLVDRYKLGLTPDHEAVLKSMLREFALMVVGLKSGRIAFPLGPGLGKSQSILAIIAALHELHYPYPVMVCASRAESLCELVEDLKTIGNVPEFDPTTLHGPALNLWESEGGSWGLRHFVSTAPRQRTIKAESARYLFTTHASLRRDKDTPAGELRNIEALATWTDPEGVEHSRMVFWDESLMVSDSWSIPKASLFANIKGLDERLPNRSASEGRQNAQREALQFLQECLPILKAEYEAQRQGQRPTVVYLPLRSEDEIETYTNALKGVAGIDESVFNLLDIAHAEIRVAVTAGYEEAAYISFQIAVHESLDRAAILDASYTTRLLCLADETVKLVDDPLITDTVVKRYGPDNEFSIIKCAGGRRGVERSALGGRDMFKEGASIIKDRPADEEWIIGTFKDRARTNRYHVAIQETVMRTFREEGVPNLDSGRIKFITYGQETASNAYRNIKNTIAFGVLQRSDGDLIGAFIGQTFSLGANLSPAEVEALKVSESTHSAYQLVHRSEMRKMQNGLAMPSRTWIFYQNPAKLWAGLSPLMPGLTLKRHKNQALPKMEDKYRAIAEKIAAYLAALPVSVTEVRCADLKQAICPQSKRTTFFKSLNAALDGVAWERTGYGWKAGVCRSK